MVLVFPLIFIIINLGKSFPEKSIKISVFGIVILFLWVILSGSGGYFNQNSDYIKHYAILTDLINIDWPVSYTSYFNKKLYLCYYVAYYLPAALVGKFFGEGASELTLFIWTYLGVLLSFSWLSKLSIKKSFFTVFIFIFFSGMDILGGLPEKIMSFEFGSHLEWWADIWQYTSNTTSLMWVPQHAISNWLITSIIICLFFENKHKHNLYFGVVVYCLSLLWSPFITIGLLPFILITVFSSKDFKVFSIQNVLTVISISIPLILYILSNSGSGPQFFIWKNYHVFKLLLSYIVFVLMEFLVFSILIWKMEISVKDIIMCIAATLSLLLIPMYHMGIFNDFAMRVSLPSLFIIQILLLKNRWGPSLIRRGVIIFLLLVGLATPINEFVRAYKYSDKARFTSLIDLPMEFLPWQYLGNDDSIFFKYLSRKSRTKSRVPISLELKLRE